MMKLKFLLLFAGVIAATAIAATPLAASAQDLQTRTRPRLILSQEQQAKLEQVQENVLTQIEAVLTPRQKAEFASARVSGQGLGIIQNLSDVQLTQIQGIFQSWNTQIADVLTPRQNQQIQQSGLTPWAFFWSSRD